MSTGFLLFEHGCISAFFNLVSFRKKAFPANCRGGYHPPTILPPLKGEVDFARRAKDGRVLNSFPESSLPESFDGRVEQAPSDEGAVTEGD